MDDLNHVSSNSLLVLLESKPYNVDPILQLGNLEVQRVARWMEIPFWRPGLGPGAM